MNWKSTLLCLLFLLVGTAQSAFGDRYDTRSIKCESDKGGFRLCPVRNMRDKEIELEKQLSKTSCRKGQSWGLSKRGIWVDNGCRAWFSVTSYQARDYDDQYDHRDRYHHNDRYHHDRDYDNHSYRDREHRNERIYRHPLVAKKSVFNVERNLDSGNSWVGPKIKRRKVNRISVRLRRLNPNQTDTHISVGFDDNQQLGAKQVDSENFHWIVFDIGSVSTRNRKIVVTSHSGTVYVDKVLVD